MTQTTRNLGFHLPEKNLFSELFFHPTIRWQSSTLGPHQRSTPDVVNHPYALDVGATRPVRQRFPEI